MSQTLAYCFGRVAPYYNLVLVIIVLLLFLRLFKTPGKKTYLRPWKFLMAAVLVYVGEEIITVFEMGELLHPSAVLFPLLEMVMITLFIYVLLLQKENVRK